MLPKTQLRFGVHSANWGGGGRKARQPNAAIRQKPGGAPQSCLGRHGRASSPRSRLCAEQNAPSLAGAAPRRSRGTPAPRRSPSPPPPPPLPAAERSRPRSAAPGRLGNRARAAQCGSLVPSSGCAAPSCRHGLRLNSCPALQLGAPAVRSRTGRPPRPSRPGGGGSRVRVRVSTHSLRGRSWERLQPRGLGVTLHASNLLSETRLLPRGELYYKIRKPSV